MKFPENNIRESWLKEHGDPAVMKLTERNLAIAEKANALLKERNIKKN